MRTIAAGEFKAKCLAVMDEVQATGQPVIVTKRGKPTVKLTPASPTQTPFAVSTSATDQGRDSKSEAAPQDRNSIFGRLRNMGVITGDIVSSEHDDEEWDRMFDEKWARFEKASAK
jgi:prevent-host-death family protein